MSRRFVSFVLGDGRYCLPVDQVMQILRPEGILDVPKAPPFVMGVINLRGEVIPVVSLKARLGLAGEPGLREPRSRIIVIKVGNRSYGLLVDDVREIIDIDETRIQREATQAFGVHAEFIQGVAQRGEGLYLVLDLPRVLSAGRDLQSAEPV